MKNVLLILSLLTASFGFAQVGIGTITPTPGYELDVAGDVLIQSEFKVDAFPDAALQDDNKFILRRLNSVPEGEVVTMDMGTRTIAPVNVINYTFTNVFRDNLESVDLQFDADRYVVGLANVRYEGDPIQKGQIGTAYTNIGNFLSRTFEENGTWHLEIRNRALDALETSDITYHVTIIVYDKKFFKILPSISVNFNGATTGSSPIPAGL